MFVLLLQSRKQLSRPAELNIKTFVFQKADNLSLETLSDSAGTGLLCLYKFFKKT